MKKLAYIILGFIVGAALTYYFCPRPSDAETMETKIVKPNGVISVDEAKELNNNWTKFRKKAVDSASERQGRNIDKRSVGWSVEDIRNYLNYAEHESKKLGYSMDSIRVYLGVYGKSKPKDEADYTTMFIAPKGIKLTSEAGMASFNLVQRSKVPPLNNGNGGGGYDDD